jgi:uncharacterized protein (DUF433 family)
MPEETEHPYIWVSPERLGGEPCLGGHRIAAEQIAESYWLGWSPEKIAEEHPGVTLAGVLVCCWFVRVYGGPHWKRRWPHWPERAGIKMAELAMSLGSFGRELLPPQRSDVGFYQESRRGDES